MNPFFNSQLNSLRRLWKQAPITPPQAEDLELTQDSWVERGAEVVGWWVARLEYWLSGSGWIRAWLRLNLIISIVLTIAGVLLIPAVSHVLKELARSSHWLSTIIVSLVAAVAVIPPAVVSIAALYLGFLLIRHFLARRKHRGHNHESGY